MPAPRDRALSVGVRDLVLLALGYAVFGYAFSGGPAAVATTLAALMTPVAALAAALSWRELRPALYRGGRLALAAVPAATAALYASFLAGEAAAVALGMERELREAWGMLRGVPHAALTLAVVSAAEEVYWRGWLQARALAGLRHPWLASALLYALAHVASGSLLLVAAALVAGLILGVTARRAGVLAAAAAHYAWLMVMLQSAEARAATAPASAPT